MRALDLEIVDGEFIVLVGPSGCGKTTALRMVAGLEQISKGTIRIGDRVVNDVPPKERDIAMVFQNYALYPHMTRVRQHGVRVEAAEDAEARDRRAGRARRRRILGLDELLDRKPRALSGGQRQRVAMGRAIVRHPQAFLMDEPLSNLDAKLRVQMRSEIARIQNDLGVTTIYVTHDQIEAMTMGDRVAVIRKGDAAAGRHARRRCTSTRVNVFVAGFIGSPGHEPARGEARRRRRGVVVGRVRRLPPAACPTKCSRPGPRCAATWAARSCSASAPRTWRTRRSCPDAPAERRICSTVDLREALGSDVIVHFTIDAPHAMTDDVKELADDVGQEALDARRAAGRGRGVDVLARLNPRTLASEGRPRSSSSSTPTACISSIPTTGPASTATAVDRP